MIKRVNIKKAPSTPPLPGPPPPPPIDECMEVIRALSDKTRQDIISIFAEKEEACVNDIAGRFSLSRPAISHHLNLMKRSRVLNARKDGKEVYYSFNREYVIGLLESLLSSLRKCC